MTVRRRAAIALCLAAATALVPARAHADEPEQQQQQQQPEPTFGVMSMLADRGLHDLDDETWNAYAQLTYISSWKLRFDAPYTNANGSPNSLVPDPERSWTGSFTLYAGARLWPGAEAYVVPEVIAEKAFSGLKGLGGAIQNFELQKTGSTSPTIYRSRAYLQQTIGLGGGSDAKPSQAMQLGTHVDRRRIVLHVGNFSVIDFFDKNTFTGNPRQQFFNMAFMTYAAYDFAADARGYSWGGIAEVFWDDWSWRIGRVAVPQDPNSLPLTLQLDRFYGDQVELEHDHKILGQAGAVRVLAYRNRIDAGNFGEAVAAFRADPGKNAAACGDRYNYGSTNASAPDLCWVRRPQAKVGIGLNVEQHVTDDVGVFFRGMISDGRSEVYAFTSTDSSVSFGALAGGTAWKRPRDLVGAGLGLGWISKSHADYLRLGGVDGFIGDGTIDRAAEGVFEIFYSVNVLTAMWLSLDYQHITNPAFNGDRGPVNVIGARFHAEL